MTFRSERQLENGSLAGIPSIPGVDAVRTPAALVCAGLLTLLCGCSIDVVRLRTETPIAEEKYDELVVGETRMDETLETLGAPNRIEWMSGDDYLWYDYGDEVDVGVVFRIPTPFFGYQHNLLRLSDAAEDLNTVQLVFDEGGLLRFKALRLTESSRPGREDGAGWKLRLTPRFGHSVLLLGDAGVENYTDVFENGFRTGLDIGFQPYPVLTLLVSGSYQHHAGKSQTIGGSRVAFGDLDLFDFHLGVRLDVPFAVFTAFLNDFDAVKRILFDEDIDRPRGLGFYVQGSAGGTLSNNVPVEIDGSRAGNFYDNALLNSTTIEGGLEYDWNWGMAYVGLTYQTMAAFDKGNSPLDDSASGLQSVLVTGGVSLRF